MLLQLHRLVNAQGAELIHFQGVGSIFMLQSLDILVPHGSQKYKHASMKLLRIAIYY